MQPTLITGNKALAAALNVSTRTVSNWRASGIIDKAVMSHYGRIIIYDLAKVLECLNYRPRH